MQRTLEYVIGLTKTPNLNPKQIEYINILWDGVNHDNMRLTKNKVKYVKIENI